MIRAGRRHDRVKGALCEGRFRTGLAGRGRQGAKQREIPLEAVAHGVGRRRRGTCGVRGASLRRCVACRVRGLWGIGRRARLSHAAILARVAPALTDEERLLQATAREFAQREVAPGAIERDETERYDRSLFTAMGALGLTAAPFPASVGGAGFSYLGWTLVMEELGAADMSMAVSLSVHILSQYPVVTWGTDEQRARWLPAMQAGEALGAFALTEPHAGSDAAAIRTRAERVGPVDAPEAYRLTGTKIWISNAPEAERYLVFATVDPDAGSRRRSRPSSWRRARPGSGSGRTSERWASGVARPRSWSSRAARCRPRTASGRRVTGTGSPSRRWGRAGSRSRPRASGLARAGLEAAAGYLGERQAFGGPLSDQQGLRFMLAEMARDVAAARALTREAAAAKDRGEPLAEVSSLAKWTASDTAMRVATDAVQLFGGSGYSRETGVERLMRDAKGAQIYEGTNQIHREIVAGEVLKRAGGG